MDFIFDNFIILFVIVSSVAAWLNKRKEAKEEEEGERRAREEMIRGLKEAKRPTPPSREASTPPTRAASTPPTRAVVEPEPPPAPPPRAVTRQDPPPAKRAEPAPWTGAAEDGAHQQLLNHQLAMQEQLAEIQRAAEQIKHQVGGARATQRRLEHRGQEPPRASIPGLKSSLKNPRQTRRAILLREILGPPIALR